MKKVLLFNFPFYSGSLKELIDYLNSRLEATVKDLTIIFTPNPEQVVQAQDNSEFAKNLIKADILLPDGMGIVWATKFLDSVKRSEGKLSSRIAGVEVVTELLTISQKRESAVLIIGGREYESSHIWLNTNMLSITTTDQRADYSQKEGTIFWTHGYNSIQHINQEEEKQIKKIIAELKPEMIFVAFGAPFQEKWVIEHKTMLEEKGVKIVMAVGGTFDFLTCKIKRAPAWMQNSGLEWIYRLYQQPWRWQRQLRLLSFIKLVLKKIID